MTTLIAVHGMRRSGNHAVIDWLRRNMTGPSVFLNDCGPGDPFRTYALMETPERDVHGPGFRATKWFAQFPDRRGGRSHVVSYEDRLPEETGLPSGWAQGAQWHGVTVHRSFLDWLASYFVLVFRRQGGTRWGVTRPDQIRPAIATYARLLKGAASRTAICFDRWRREAQYRGNRLAALGLTPHDDSLGPPAEYGGGSSFGRDAPHRRWRALQTDPDYRALVSHAARDDALMTQLSFVYPEDAARLARLDRTGSFDLEDDPWFN